MLEVSFTMLKIWSVITKKAPMKKLSLASTMTTATGAVKNWRCWIVLKGNLGEGEDETDDNDSYPPWKLTASKTAPENSNGWKMNLKFTFGKGLFLKGELFVSGSVIADAYLLLHGWFLFEA